MLHITGRARPFMPRLMRVVAVSSSFPAGRGPPWNGDRAGLGEGFRPETLEV
ncbi:hypothetical protein FIU91_11660 [Roseivivax sp. THAF30]|nr:hypothetical protein FIU91_11660 [Roseivivax sp. THAF30]